MSLLDSDVLPATDEGFTPDAARAVISTYQDTLRALVEETALQPAPPDHPAPPYNGTLTMDAVVEKYEQTDVQMHPLTGDLWAILRVETEVIGVVRGYEQAQQIVSIYSPE